MGLLSALSFGQQSPWLRFQQPPQVQPIPQPTQPEPQLAPMPSTANAQVRPPNFSERIEGLYESPLLNMGLSLLGNAQNGGNWSGVAQDMQGFNQQRMLQQRERNAERRATTQDQREGTIFGRQQTEWQHQDQQRADWQAALQREQDPNRRAQLQAIGPAGYGDYLARERQMEFQAREGQLDRDAQTRAASIRSANENSLGRYFQSMDAQTLGELNQQAAQLQAVGLPQLRALRGTISGASGLVGQPIDYNTRITLGRYFNGSSADRQTLEVWNAQILGPALETLRGLGAMSEREMEAAINSFSNPNMTLGAAMQLLDERITTAERRVSSAQAAGQFFRDAGGLTGTTNSAGQDWPTYLQSQLAETPGSGATDRTMVPRGGYQAPPSAAVAELRRDSSAAARREFDQVFGPGAAARALAGQSERRVPQAARGAGRPGAF